MKLRLSTLTLASTGMIALGVYNEPAPRLRRARPPRGPALHEISDVHRGTP
jgi:hypothetical protein